MTEGKEKDEKILELEELERSKQAQIKNLHDDIKLLQVKIANANDKMKNDEAKLIELQ